MKRALLLVALCAVVLVACEPAERGQRVRLPQEYPSIGYDNVKYERFEMDGHTYIKFYQGISGYHECAGYEHDPECLRRDLKEWGYGAE